MNNLTIHRLIQNAHAGGEDPVSVVQSQYILRWNVHYARKTIADKVAEVVAMARLQPEWFTEGDDDAQDRSN